MNPLVFFLQTNVCLTLLLPVYKPLKQIYGRGLISKPKGFSEKFKENPKKKNKKVVEESKEVKKQRQKLSTHKGVGSKVIFDDLVSG